MQDGSRKGNQQRGWNVRRARYRRAGGRRGGLNDASEVGADFLCGVGDCRCPWLYRRIGSLGGYRPVSVLRVRSDLPGPADPGPDDLPGVAGASPVVMPALVAGIHVLAILR